MAPTTVDCIGVSANLSASAATPWHLRVIAPAGPVPSQLNLPMCYVAFDLGDFSVRDLNRTSQYLGSKPLADLWIGQKPEKEKNL